MSAELGAMIDEGRRDFRDGLDRLAAGLVDETPHNAYLSALSGILNNPELDRDQACGYLAYASLDLIDARAELEKTLDNWDAMAEMREERYRLAWTSARQRAAGLYAALVESDAERDHLAAQLRERDEEVLDLATRLAQYCGITS